MDPVHSLALLDLARHFELANFVLDQFGDIVAILTEYLVPLDDLFEVLSLAVDYEVLEVVVCHQILAQGSQIETWMRVLRQLILVNKILDYIAVVLLVESLAEGVGQQFKDRSAISRLYVLVDSGFIIIDHWCSSARC